MLRYFYIIICIQFCFCTVYIDKPEKENLERRVRSKNTRLHKKQTRSYKQSQLVQFDVQNFMRRYRNDAVDENGLYADRDRIRENRHILTNDGKNSRDRNKVVDYPSNDNQITRLNTRSVLENFPDLNSNHFTFPSQMFDDKNDLRTTKHDHEKLTSNMPSRMLPEREVTSDMKKKCSFKHMKMPFFSYNKLTTKAKRQKKRKLFCFNCHRKTTTASYMGNHVEDSLDSKSDEDNKYHSSDKNEKGANKVAKRAYDQLCPKCIRELLNSLKRKSTKKVQHGTKTHSYKKTKTTKEKITTPKIDVLDNNLQNSYYYLSIERKKRSDAEENENERERRLKELEDVERKIEMVHITAPTFTKVPFNFKIKLR